ADQARRSHDRPRPRAGHRPRWLHRGVRRRPVRSGWLAHRQGRRRRARRPAVPRRAPATPV
ncbi:MAG: hypothetical protein AVDCRST_MAG76-2313, partial [uncultured Acidimicrobiales bacterium]